MSCYVKPYDSLVIERFVPKGNVIVKSGTLWGKKSHSAADSCLTSLQPLTWENKWDLLCFVHAFLCSQSPDFG